MKASSSSSEDQPKKYPVGQHSDMNYNHPLPTDNSQGNYPPSPAMGYPPAPTTMGYPPQYQGYPPNNASYNYYPYNQPPPGPYYNPQSQTPGGSAFVRGFVVMFVILITLTCISSIIVWLILRPETPEFKIDSVTVTNFNVSKTYFSANWEANITVHNRNHKLKVYFDRIQSFVYYDEDFLASSSVDPMFLNTNARDVMKLKLSTNNTDQHVVGDWVLNDMTRERNGGTVEFNVRMLVFSTFKSGVWWTRQATLKVFCEDLKVHFVGTAMDGTLAGGETDQCIVYYS